MRLFSRLADAPIDEEYPQAMYGLIRNARPG